MVSGLRAAVAAVLRALAALLFRLSRALDATAAQAPGEPAPPPGWPPPGRRPPPPPHWVELVRERAPQLLDGDGRHNGARPPAAVVGARPAPPAAARPAFAPNPPPASPTATGFPANPPPPAPAASGFPANPPPTASTPPDFPANPHRAPSAPASSAARLRIRAVVEELDATDWGSADTPKPALTATATVTLPEITAVPTQAEPASRWPTLPPSLEPLPEAPYLRERERLRVLTTEQRGD